MSLSEATRLYQQGNYLDCIDACNSILEKKEYSSDVFALTAKSIIGNSAYPIKDSEKSLFIDCVNNAVSFSNSIKEICDIKHGIEIAFQEWRKKALEIALQNLAKDFNINQYQKYIDVEIFVYLILLLKSLNLYLN